VSEVTSSLVAEYRQQIERKQNHITLTEQDNGEKLCERRKKSINSVAEEIPGIMELVNKGTWFDGECQAATDDKNKALKKMNKDMVLEV